MRSLSHPTDSWPANTAAIAITTEPNGRSVPSGKPGGHRGDGQRGKGMGRLRHRPACRK